MASLEVRVTMFPRRIFYLGIEAMLGSFGVPSGPTQPTKRSGRECEIPGDAQRWPLDVSLGGVAGASPPVGRFDLSLELFGGFARLPRS